MGPQISIQLQMALIRLQQKTSKKYLPRSNRTGIKIYGFLSTGFDPGWLRDALLPCSVADYDDE